ncbi:MAG: hypothetical protein V1922_05320 [bacterium]
MSYIIENRVQENNKEWIKKIKKIGEIGPTNVGLLDTLSGVVEGKHGTLLIDRELIKEIEFIREGEFDERQGARTLKLVGSVQPINAVEIAQVIKRRITDDYPYSYKKLENIIKRQYPEAKINAIQSIIKENDMKNDAKYSVYNFRNKDQEEAYKKTKKIFQGIPSIYNDAAIQFLLKVLKNK